MARVSWVLLVQGPSERLQGLCDTLRKIRGVQQIKLYLGVVVDAARGRRCATPLGIRWRLAVLARSAVRTLRGSGEAAAGGAGDLHVTVHVKAHPLFAREGADVLLEVPISFPQAVLGAFRDPATVDQMLDAIWSRGPLTGLVNNAAGN